jgi:hypothetical protein
MTARLIDLGGQRFGRWRVVGPHPERMRYGRRRHAVAVLWQCVCDCGEQRLVFGSNLRAGYSKSCGCLKREQTIKRSTKHGHARRGNHTSIYDRWVSMRQRCFDPNHKSYPDYGGRGVGVCPEWHADFMAFYRHVGDAPPGLSIDRIDVDGNYEPGNWRWATASEQVRNRRPSKRKKRKGRRADLAEIQVYAASLARATSAPGGVRGAP